MANLVDVASEKNILIDTAVSSDELFDLFVKSEDLLDVLGYFYQLCESVDLNPQHFKTLYSSLKTRLTSWKCKNLWNRLDKKAKHVDYKNRPCAKLKVLIIGAGPCGLRAAIEVALLGAHVVVVEKRDSFSRNNVLHLWPFLIVDLKALGAKNFFGKFCAGSLDHISIKRLQCILLKVCLLLGVQVYPQTGFQELIEPAGSKGWRAKFSPSSSQLNDFEFDAIIGCDGKRNTLQGFKRKEFRGKLAIAITCNFVNRNTQEEARVEEISGVAFIFNQTFFRELKDKTGIDLENIVYYKDETHYFVMTAKKKSLLDKGVIIKDYRDVSKLLSVDNVNHRALCQFATEAADFSTHYQLPHHEFARNHYGKEDIAMFDFTSIFQAENSSRIIERKGKRLLVAVAGDTLLEPFWPTGSGCARGFLGAMDAAWMVRGLGLARDPVELIQERESVFTLLPQTTPDRLMKEHANYSVNPATRYPNLNLKAVKKKQVEHLYDTASKPVNEPSSGVATKPNASDLVDNKAKDATVDAKKLLKWCQDVTSVYPTVKINDLSISWKNGLAFCAIIHRFNPDLLDFWDLDASASAKNCQLAFDIAEEHYGIPPKTSGKDFVASGTPDRLVVISYLSLLHDVFKAQTEGTLKGLGRQQKLSPGTTPPSSPKKSPLSKMSIASRLSRRSKKKQQKTESRLQRKSRHDKETKIYEKTDGVFLKGFKGKGEEALNLISEEPDGPDSAKAKKAVRKGKQGDRDAVLQIGTTPIDIDKMIGNGNAPKKIPIDIDSEPKRVGNKVSQLAESLFGETKGKAPKTEVEVSESEVCHFCRRHVYVMERMSAEGLFFHRRCFRCRDCSCNLLLGNYAFYADDDLPGGGDFFCKPHYNQILYSKPKEKAIAEQGRVTGRGRRAYTQVLDAGDVHEAFQGLAKRGEPSPTKGEENNNEVDGKTERSPSDPIYISPYSKFEAKPLIRKPPERVFISQSMIPISHLKHAVSTPSLQKLLQEDELFAEERKRLASSSGDSKKRKLIPSNDLRNSIRSMLDDSDENLGNVSQRTPTPAGLGYGRRKLDLDDEHGRDISPRRVQYPESMLFPDNFNIPGLKTVTVDINLCEEEEEKIQTRVQQDRNEDVGSTETEEATGKTKKKKFVLRKAKGPKAPSLETIDEPDQAGHGSKTSSPLLPLKEPVSTKPETPPKLAPPGKQLPELPPTLEDKNGGRPKRELPSRPEVSPKPKKRLDASQLREELRESQERLDLTDGDKVKPGTRKKLDASDLRALSSNPPEDRNTGLLESPESGVDSPSMRSRLDASATKEASPRMRKKLDASDLKAESPKTTKKLLPVKVKDAKKKEKEKGKEKKIKDKDVKSKKADKKKQKELMDGDWLVVQSGDGDWKDGRISTDSLSSDEDVGPSSIFKRAFGIRPKPKSKAELAQEQADEERRQKKKEMLKIEKEMKERKSKRLWQAQSIQRKMNEVDLKQFELDERALAVERGLRSDIGPSEEGPLMMEWFQLVNDKNILLRFESELVIQANSIQLEDQQARLEQEIRTLLTSDHPQPGDQTKIDALTKELVDTVEQRNALVEMLEEDRLREMEEDKQLHDVMVKKSQEFGMDRLI